MDVFGVVSQTILKNSIQNHEGIVWKLQLRQHMVFGIPQSPLPQPSLTPNTATSIAQDVGQIKVKVESPIFFLFFIILSDLSSDDEADVAYINPTFSSPHLAKMVSSHFTSSTSLRMPQSHFVRYSNLDLQEIPSVLHYLKKLSNTHGSKRNCDL